MALYIYSETAFHHEGDLDYLEKLIRLSAEMGLNGIKFQILTDLDYLISTRHSAYEQIKPMILSEAQWLQAIRLCGELNLDVIFMPINPDALNIIPYVRKEVKYLDLHPVSFNDQPTLESIRKVGIPLILGIGGRTIEEIDNKLAFFGPQLQVLMCGFQAFPSQLSDIRLEKIALLKQKYPHLQIGYADHSSYDHADAVRSNEWAYLQGARFFEKHLTLEEGRPREDYESAVGENKFRQMTEALRYMDTQVFSIPKDKLLEFTPAEVKYRNRERVAVAKRDLPEGTIITSGAVAFKMIDKQGGFPRFELIAGKALRRSIPKDEILLQEDLQ
jgi:N,N'-diacetyllegionaminate synthase